MRVQSLLLFLLFFRVSPCLADLDPNRPLFSPLNMEANERILWELSDKKRKSWRTYNVDEQQAKMMLDDPM